MTATRLTLLLASVLTACGPGAIPKGPQRALQIVHNRHNHHSAEQLALDATHVYILDGNADSFGIRRLPRGGGLTESITDDNESGIYPSAIAVDDTHIYWLVAVPVPEGTSAIDVFFGDAGEPQTRLFRAEKTKTPRLEQLAKVDGIPGDLVLVGNEVIFSTLRREPALHRISKSGSSHSVFFKLDPGSRPVDILVHGTKFLVAVESPDRNSEDGTILEVSLAGESRKLLDVKSPVELAESAGKLALVTSKGVVEVPTGTQLTKGSRDARFDALAAAPEGLYYRHHEQLRFLPWGATKSQILQKAKYEIEDVVVADEGLYYIDRDAVWFRARAN